MLEKLQIIIEADATALKVATQQAIISVTNMVNAISNKKVDWKKMFASGVSQSVLSSVAGSFALAITQAVQFQNSMMNAGNNTSDSMAQSANQINDSMIALATQTKGSLVDTTNAYNAFNNLLNDPSAAQQATVMTQQLADSIHMDLGTAVEKIIPLLDNWGVNSIGGIKTALTGLSNSFGKGKFSPVELMNELASSGDSLKHTGLSITNVATSLQTLSRQGGATKDQVRLMFQAIQEGVDNPLSALNVTTLKIKESLGTNGFIGTIEKLKIATNDYGGNVSILAEKMGIPIKTVIALQDQQLSKLKLADAEGKTQIANQKSLQEIQAKGVTATMGLQKAWNEFNTTLGKTGIALLPVLNTITSFMTNMLPLINTVMNGLVDVGSAISQGVESTAGMKMSLLGVVQPSDNLTPLAKKMIADKAKKGTLGNVSVPSATQSSGGASSSSVNTNANVTINVTAQPGNEQVVANKTASTLNQLNKNASGITSQ